MNMNRKDKMNLLISHIEEMRLTIEIRHVDKNGKVEDFVVSGNTSVLIFLTAGKGHDKRYPFGFRNLDAWWDCRCYTISHRICSTLLL